MLLDSGKPSGSAQSTHVHVAHGLIFPCRRLIQNSNPGESSSRPYKPSPPYRTINLSVLGNPPQRPVVHIAYSSDQAACLSRQRMDESEARATLRRQFSGSVFGEVPNVAVKYLSDTEGVQGAYKGSGGGSLLASLLHFNCAMRLVLQGIMGRTPAYGFFCVWSHFVSPATIPICSVPIRSVVRPRMDGVLMRPPSHGSLQRRNYFMCGQARDGQTACLFGRVRNYRFGGRGT